MYKSASSSDEHVESEWEQAGCWSQFTFSVPNRMLRTGSTQELTFDDMTSQPKSDHVAKLLIPLRKQWAQSKAVWFIPRLMVSLLRSMPYHITILFSGTVIETTLQILKPVMLMAFLNKLADPTASTDDKYLYASGIAGLGVAYVVVHHILFFFSMRTGWSWRMVTQAMVFEHLLSLDSSSLQYSSKGNMVNLISNDVEKFERFCVFMMFVITGPFEIIALLVLMANTLDWLSALAGLGITIMFLPLEIKMGGEFAKWRTKTARNTDKRIRHIGESIEGISSLKSYGWETPFFALIKKLRSHEQDTISRSQALKAVNKAFDYCMVPTSNLVMQWVYWLRGGQLDLSKLFACLLFLQVLRSSVFIHWTAGIEMGSESIASCHRLEAFLSLTPADKRAVSESSAKNGEDVEIDGIQLLEKSAEPKAEYPHSEGTSDELVLRIPGKNFCYSSLEGTKAVLSNINVELKKNELLIVVGPVGSGKSSFLGAVLGELNEIEFDSSATGNTPTASTSFFIGEHPRIAFCPQIPWIFSASVQENIIVSGISLDRSQYDKGMYDLALSSCCIEEDLKQLPDRDATEIGEKGVSISGGQKARLALARAVYSDADIYLLDDPLSAVDAHVSRALLDDCIIGALKQRGKTVVLCTHQMQYLKYADKVLVLGEDGNQKYYGSYAGLQQGESNNLLLNQLEIEVKQRASSVSSEGRDRSKSVSELLVNESEVSTSSKDDSVVTSSKTEVKSIIEKELKAIGNISLSVYTQWLRAGGLLRGVFVFFLITASQAMLMVHEYWLRWWIGKEFNLTDSQYLWIMGIMTFFIFIVGFFRVKLFYGFTIRASSGLHQGALWSILHSPLSFFTANPTGRILNRFSKDQSQADELLPSTLFDCYNCTMICAGAIVLVCVAMPIILVSIPPLLLLFVTYRRKYMASMREIKRIEAITRSPIYAGFSATLEGLTSIRAYKLQQKMSTIFCDFLDENGRAWWSYLMASRWFGFRMDSTAIIFLMLTSYGSVYYSDVVDLGLLGFALVYSMNLAGLMQWTVRLSAEVESMMTGIERIAEYSLLPEEPGYASTLSSVLREIETAETEGSVADITSSTGNLQDGSVVIHNMVARYRTDLEPVLNGLTLNVQSGSKCGIVGRTGSGKSTILSALIRLNIIGEKSVMTIGGRDILKMSLEEARSAVTIIPQQPHLFLGSLRFNLDPFNRYTDEAIWKALTDANIAEFVKANHEGLGFHVDEGGSNLSVGQKQLLSMARAILRESKIILMDEVTASVDYETDTAIQRTIRTAPALKDATIITVAHRLQTIADADSLFVISGGAVVEQGSPLELLDKKGSFFEALVRKSGESKLIRDIATARKGSNVKA